MLVVKVRPCLLLRPLRVQGACFRLPSCSIADCGDGLGREGRACALVAFAGSAAGPPMCSSVGTSSAAVPHEAPLAQTALMAIAVCDSVAT